MRKDDITIGLNKTGMKASPILSGEMLEIMELQEDVPAPEIGMLELRGAYRDIAEPVGTVPPPMSVRGAVDTAANMLMGKQMHVLLDKLSERAAYERTGTRLYDAFLSKLDGAGALPGDMTIEAVEEQRADEMAHFDLLVEAIESLGGDPTTQTPCADITGVQGMGLMQAMNDPRTTIPQALNTLLAAELIDQASWELLIELAEGFEKPELAERFYEALQAENRHAMRVRSWLTAALSESALGT